MDFIRDASLRNTQDRIRVVFSRGNYHFEETFLMDNDKFLNKKTLRLARALTFGTLI